MKFSTHRFDCIFIHILQGQGNYDLPDTQLNYTGGNLLVNANVEARHPDTGNLQEAVVNKIFDKSLYTVVFDDGDIATLRRNALRMKSGKHFNASESLDNLPLTHPEHFGTPVGSKRRKFGEEEEEEEESSDDEADNVPYISKLGSVVCVEVTDKKSSKAKENWFPGLIVSPYSQDQVKINTKEDFLVRSFKDHRYYTVPKTECKKFHKDMGKGVTDQGAVKAIEHAIAYIESENLPVHWDKDILFDMRDESTTEGESEDEELLLSDEDDTQSPEEKDHLVAELYKHMDDRGSPINKTPSIGDHDVDLYRLFRFVQKLGGSQRVTNNNQWRIVAKKLGFETNWCVNQVKVIYKRYLHSFEDLYRTLGCTLINHPRNNSLRVRHGSGRPLMRGVRTGSKVKDEDGSDKSSVSSQESGDLVTGVKKDEVCDEIDLDGVKQKPDSEEKKPKKPVSVVDKIIKDEPLDEETEIFDTSKKGKEVKSKKVKEERMLTRPRRDSSSSLAAATELKAKKDEIGESSKSSRKEPKKEVKKVPKEVKETKDLKDIKDTKDVKTVKEIKEVKDIKDVKDDDDKSDSGSNGSKSSKPPRRLKRKEEEEPMDQDEECNSDLDNVGKKKKVNKKKGNKTAELAPVEPMAGQEGEEPQHLKPSVECSLGDKIKVFWLHGQIYEAKIIKVDTIKSKGKWPRYYVHYQGWNQRYDEWITRGRIAENLTWNANPKKSSSSSSSNKSMTPPPEKQKVKAEKIEKRSSDEDEKRDSDDRIGSEEEKDVDTRRKTKSARSSTPSSTPGSSRTSSPAHNRRTKSPAPKRPNSPKEKTPFKDKKTVLQRTNSPAQRKSPLLKRQSSRNSLHKQSDDDFEVSDNEDEEEKTSNKRTSKIEKESVDSKVETKRSVKAANSKSEPKGKKNSEPEKEEEKKIEHSKTAMRSRRSATPTKKLKPSSAGDNDNDPYVFQEPEPMEPFVKIENISAADIAKHSKAEIKENIGRTRDSKGSVVEEVKVESESEVVKTEDIKQEDKSAELTPTIEEGSEVLKKGADKVKEEINAESEEREEKDGEKKGSSYDRYASLFPHLVSLRTGQSPPADTPSPAAATPSSPDPGPEDDPATEESAAAVEITSENVINSIVESTIMKETMDVKASTPPPDSKESVASTSVLDSKEESKDDVSTDANPPKQRTRNKKSKKVRNLRNPTHISREVVTDSDSDSEEEKQKPKPPVTPRRKAAAAAEAEKSKTPKRAKEIMESDEEDSQTSKRSRRRAKDDEDDSLVCEETLPGSPVQPCSTDLGSKPAGGRDSERAAASSRVEMPFASVASSGGSAGDKGTAQQPASALAPLQTSLKGVESPPATPDSSNSAESQSPLVRSRKDDGRKSPAESSEVDLESLTGRGKAGSEDSRMDVECSSSSETRRPGRRRPAASKDVEKEEEKSLPPSAKRKRKARGDSSGRGRGKGRGRNSSGVGRGVGRNVDESDDSEKDSRVIDEQKLERLDNAALADLAKPKPNSTSKYNFYVMLSKYQQYYVTGLSKFNDI